MKKRFGQNYIKIVMGFASKLYKQFKNTDSAISWAQAISTAYEVLSTTFDTTELYNTVTSAKKAMLQYYDSITNEVKEVLFSRANSYKVIAKGELTVLCLTTNTVLSINIVHIVDLCKV